MRSMCLALLGRFPEALAAAERALELTRRDPDLVGQLGWVRARAGDRTGAQELLEELEVRARSEYVSPMQFALIYTGLGDRSRALERLEAGLAERASQMILLRAHPAYDPLRSDPRFQDLLRRIGFSES